MRRELEQKKLLLPSRTGLVAQLLALALLRKNQDGKARAVRFGERSACHCVDAAQRAPDWIFWSLKLKSQDSWTRRDDTLAASFLWQAFSSAARFHHSAASRERVWDFYRLQIIHYNIKWQP